MFVGIPRSWTDTSFMPLLKPLTNFTKSCISISESIPFQYTNYKLFFKLSTILYRSSGHTFCIWSVNYRVPSMVFVRLLIILAIGSFRMFCVKRYGYSCERTNSQIAYVDDRTLLNGLSAGGRPILKLQVTAMYAYRVAQKVSHYQVSLLNRIKNCH